MFTLVFLLYLSYAILSNRFSGFHGQRLGTSLDLKPEVSRKSKFEEIYSLSIIFSINCLRELRTARR